MSNIRQRILAKGNFECPHCQERMLDAEKVQVISLYAHTECIKEIPGVKAYREMQAGSLRERAEKYASTSLRSQYLHLEPPSREEQKLRRQMKKREEMEEFRAFLEKKKRGEIEVDED